MRIFFTFLFLTVLITPAFAQEKTLLGEVHQSSSFVGPIVKFTSLDNKVGVLVGGYGGVVYNNKFAIGVGGFGLVNRPEEHSIGYGGMLVEYIHNSANLSHFSCGFLIGAGGVERKENGVYRSKPVFVFEPEIKHMLNVTDGIRLGICASYRLMSGSNVSNSFYSNPTLGIIFKFVKSNS
ncbi:hypothetical protein ACFL5H_04400 [Candidatus Latescibacterota bacterium]